MTKYDVVYAPRSRMRSGRGRENGAESRDGRGGGNRPLEALQLALTKVDKKFVRRPGRPECMKQDRRAWHHNHSHINNNGGTDL